ncbi:MAG: hypothetical protein NVSMB31_20290 [Vulcanimicrobiaceae bacterium]
MSRSNAFELRRLLLHGLGAGIIGGVLIDVFLYFAMILPNHGSLGSLYASIASNALGDAAFSNPGAVWLGAFMHLCISVAWGMGFAYAVATRRDILSHPYVAGLVFGFVVQIIMQIVLAITGHFHKPTAPMFAGSFLAHTLFFGLPIALYFSTVLQHPGIASNR